MKHALLLFLLVPLTSSYRKYYYSHEFFQSVLKNVSTEITSSCREQFQRFVDNLNTNGTPWSQQSKYRVVLTQFIVFKVVDATSRVPLGSVTLKFDDLGDFEKCIRVKTSDEVHGKYCLGQVSFGTKSALRVRDTISFVAPVWAMCVPDGCSTTDTNTLANVVLPNLVEDDGVRVSFLDVHCQTMKDAEPELTFAAIATM